MKKLFSLITITGLLFLFGCTKSGPTPPNTTVTPTINDTTNETNVATQPITTERQTYESKTDKFTIQFPTTRTFQENIFGSSVIFSTPLAPGDTIKENVSIVINYTTGKISTLDEYYAVTKPELLNLVPGFTEISKENIKIHDIDAQKLIYKGTQEGHNLEWEQIYLIRGNIVYIITYTATEATFSDFAKTIDEMVATLEIK